VRVVVDGCGRPTSVFSERSQRELSVAEILDRWRIDDEWWRKEISRLYYHVALEGGRLVTIFHDLVDGGWFIQTTATPRRQAEPVQVLAPRAAATPPAAIAPPAERQPNLPIRRIGVA
jgi:hypothetical protein